MRPSIAANHDDVLAVEKFNHFIEDGRLKSDAGVVDSEGELRTRVRITARLEV
jgi:hypothetical protein